MIFYKQWKMYAYFEFNIFPKDLQARKKKEKDFEVFIKSERGSSSSTASEQGMVQ